MTEQELVRIKNVVIEAEKIVRAITDLTEIEKSFKGLAIYVSDIRVSVLPEEEREYFNANFRQILLNRLEVLREKFWNLKV